jgi:hypothetical protein
MVQKTELNGRIYVLECRAILKEEKEGGGGGVRFNVSGIILYNMVIKSKTAYNIITEIRLSA